MRKIQFVSDQFYHIYNRGNEKRVIFTDVNEYSRFLLGLRFFNTSNPVDIKLLTAPGDSIIPITRLSLEKQGLALKSNTMVKILAFCLMPNHFHLLLRQEAEDGISAFMQKIGTGYTMYFNKKHERVGSLFQGTFKAKLIEEEAYLTHLLRYIHLNPVELVEPSWKNEGIKDWKRAVDFLNSYKWSSFHDYNGQEAHPQIISKDFLLELIGGSEQHKKFVREWLAKDLVHIDDLIIED